MNGNDSDQTNFLHVVLEQVSDLPCVLLPRVFVIVFFYHVCLLLFSVAFRMYDLDGDDKISKEELLAVLTMMVGANISQDQLDSIAERTVMEADADQVGKHFTFVGRMT